MLVFCFLSMSTFPWSELRINEPFDDDTPTSVRSALQCYLNTCRDHGIDAFGYFEKNFVPAPPAGPPPDSDSDEGPPPPPPYPEDRPPAPKPRPPVRTPPVRKTSKTSASSSAAAAAEPATPVTPPLGPRKHHLERQSASSPFLPMPTRLPERLAVDASVVHNVMLPSCNYVCIVIVNCHCHCQA